ncbi:MAG: ankyrin repeat domain-containing protein [Deltaproteobacteria bacterium]|nr:ankyrin repeat domain-containing protein [Deltaproteobacteria bacterium]
MKLAKHHFSIFVSFLLITLFLNNPGILLGEENPPTQDDGVAKEEELAQSLMGPENSPEEDETELHAAIRARDLSKVKRLIQKGENVNAQTKKGNTPLHLAAYFGNSDIAQALLDAGANVHAHNIDGNYPLHIASCHGHKAFVQVLIHKGVNVNLKNNHNETALLIAAHMQQPIVLKMLIAEHADVQAKARGVNALDWALENDDEQSIEALLAAWATLDVNKLYPCGHTPLFHAAKEGHIHALNTLIFQMNADVNVQDEKTGATPLHIAACEGHAAVVKVLVQANADINAQDKNGDTPLHFAVVWRKIEVMKVLIEANADRNIKNNHGSVPVEYARATGHQEAVDVLEEPVIQEPLYGELKELFEQDIKGTIEQLEGILLDPSLDHRIGEQTVDQYQQLLKNFEQRWGGDKDLVEHRCLILIFESLGRVVQNEDFRKQQGPTYRKIRGEIILPALKKSTETGDSAIHEVLINIITLSSERTAVTNPSEEEKGVVRYVIQSPQYEINELGYAYIDGAAYTLAFDPKGEWVFYGGEEEDATSQTKKMAVVWKVSIQYPHEELHKYQFGDKRGPITSLATVSNGTFLFAGGFNVVLWWSLLEKKWSHWTIPGGGFVRSLAVVEKLLGEVMLFIISDDNKVRILTLNTSDLAEGTENTYFEHSVKNFIGKKCVTVANLQNQLFLRTDQGTWSFDVRPRMLEGGESLPLLDKEYSVVLKNGNEYLFDTASQVVYSQNLETQIGRSMSYLGGIDVYYKKRFSSLRFKMGEEPHCVAVSDDGARFAIGGKHYVRVFEIVETGADSFPKSWDDENAEFDPELRKSLKILESILASSTKPAALRKAMSAYQGHLKVFEEGWINENSSQRYQHRQLALIFYSLERVIKNENFKNRHEGVYYKTTMDDIIRPAFKRAGRAHDNELQRILGNIIYNP